MHAGRRRAELRRVPAFHHHHLTPSLAGNSSRPSQGTPLARCRELRLRLPHSAPYGLDNSCHVWRAGRLTPQLERAPLAWCWGRTRPSFSLWRAPLLSSCRTPRSAPTRIPPCLDGVFSPNSCAMGAARLSQIDCGMTIQFRLTALARKECFGYLEMLDKQNQGTPSPAARCLWPDPCCRADLWAVLCREQAPSGDGHVQLKRLETAPSSLLTRKTFFAMSTMSSARLSQFQSPMTSS
jgi:hypothetical protein